MTKLLSVLSLLLLPFLGNGAQEERVLRHDLFNNYNKDVRPVVEYQDPVNLPLFD